MTKHSNTWFYKFSARNGGELAHVSQQLREEILDRRAAGMTKREIAEGLGVHLNTIRKVTWKARLDADPRAYKGTTRMSKIMASCDSVIELRNYQWFVRGLADRLEIHYTQVEALIDDVVDDVQAKMAAAIEAKAKAKNGEIEKLLAIEDVKAKASK